MKKIHLHHTLAISIVVFLALVGCKDEEVPAANPGFIVATGFPGTSASIRYSVDGVSWPLGNITPISQNYLINGITFGNGYYVAVGNGLYTCKSVNGIDWEFTQLDTTINYNDIAFGEYHNKMPWLPYFVAVGSYGAVMFTSDNGSTWSRGSSGITTTLNAVTFAYTAEGLSMFVAVGNRPNIFSSDGYNQSVIIYSLTAGESWIKHSSGGTTKALYCVAYGNGKFIAAGEYGEMIYSTNGAAWQYLKSNTGKNIEGICYGIANNSPVWVAVGQDGTVLYSQDNGANWAAGVFGPNKTWKTVICRGNKFYAAGYGRDGGYLNGVEGAVIYSNDGITWQNAASFAGQENYIREIAAK